MACIRVSLYLLSQTFVEDDEQDQIDMAPKLNEKMSSSSLNSPAIHARALAANKKCMPRDVRNQMIGSFRSHNCYVDDDDEVSSVGCPSSTAGESYDDDENGGLIVGDKRNESVIYDMSMLRYTEEGDRGQANAI
jgi:hypothetical protein